MKAPPWLTVLVVLALLAALYLNWTWPWGVLFLYWTVTGIRSGETRLIGPLTQRDEPFLYWCVTVLWLLLSILLIMLDAAPDAVTAIYTFLWGVTL